MIAPVISIPLLIAAILYPFYWLFQDEGYGNYQKDRFSVNTECENTQFNSMNQAVVIDDTVYCVISGMTLDESFEIAKILAHNGADSVQITARTISFKFGEDGDHAFLSYANKLSEELDIPIILGGTLRDMKTMNDILNTTSIEFFSLTKPFVAQQDFLLEWKENGEGVSRCKSCNNCYGKKESRCFQFG